MTKRENEKQTKQTRKTTLGKGVGGDITIIIKLKGTTISRNNFDCQRQRSKLTANK